MPLHIPSTAEMRAEADRLDAEIAELSTRIAELRRESSALRAMADAADRAAGLREDLPSDAEESSLSSFTMEGQTDGRKTKSTAHRRKLSRARIANPGHHLVVALGDRSLTEYAKERTAARMKRGLPGVSLSSVSRWVAGVGPIPRFEAEFAQKHFGRLPDDDPKRPGDWRVPATPDTWRGGILETDGTVTKRS